MKKLITGMILVICLLVSVSCGRGSSESRVEEQKPVLTEEQEEQLAEKGFIIVLTVEEASRLAGYSVATPEFLPEDLRLHEQILVAQLGLGEWGTRKRHVDLMWSWPEGAHLLLTQAPGMDVLAGREPTEICGRPGAREFFEAGNGREHPLLVLHWHDGNMGYSLGGSIAGPLTEEILYEIACSVEVR